MEVYGAMIQYIMATYNYLNKEYRESSFLLSGLFPISILFQLQPLIVQENFYHRIISIRCVPQFLKRIETSFFERRAYDRIIFYKES
jgi:hypothetical protein